MLFPLKTKCLLSMLICVWFAATAFAQSETQTPETLLLQPEAPVPTGHPAVLEAYVDAAVRMSFETDKTVGLTVSVVKDGEIVLLKGYGYAHLENRVPVDPSFHTFRIGSVSKPIVFTALMQLVEQGKIELDADVNDYLSAFKIPEKFGAPIRVVDLLTHRPGFEESLRGAFGQEDDFTPLEAYLADNMPARVLPPGAYTSYSNYGAALAGYLVQVVSGQTLEAYLEDQIFAPLNMHSASLGQVLEPSNPQAMPVALRDRIASVYTLNNGYPERHPFELIVPAPAGAISATSADMAKFMLAHLQEGELINQRILSQETALMMRTRPYPDREAADFAHGLVAGELLGYVTFEHGGATITSFSGLTMVPELELGVFVSVNGTTNPAGPMQLTHLILRQMIGNEARASREVRTLSEAELNGYAGAYMTTRRFYTGVLKFFMAPSAVMTVTATTNGTLTSAFGPYSSELVPVGEHLFQDVATGALVNFLWEDGTERAMAMTSPNGTSTAMRVDGRTNFGGIAMAFVGLILLAVTHLISAWKRRSEPEYDSVLTRRLSQATVATSLLVLLMTVALVLVFTAFASGGISFLIDDWPSPAMTVFFSAVLLLILATLGLGAGLWSVARSPDVSIWRKAHYGLLLLALIYFLSQATHWNLIGFNYW